MSEIKVDTVAEKTSANGVTVDGLSIKDSKLVTANSVITSNITDDNVTYGKIQNVSATDRILGRDSSGAGVIEEITPANLRTMLNVANGANVGGGQFEFVSRATVTSDVAQVVFTNLTANTYHKFVLQGIDSDNNGGEDFCFQLSTDNGSNYLTATNYRWNYFQSYSSGNTNCTASNSSNKICMFDGFHTSDIDEGIFGEVMLNHVGNGQKPMAFWQGANVADNTNKLRSSNGAGFYESGVSINAIKFFFDTGDINNGAYTFITHYKGIIS